MELNKASETNGLNVRPKACCAMGSYGCQVPMPLNGRIQGIDYCIADIVAALNAANISTVASCCGHNEVLGRIMLTDGRILDMSNHVRPWEGASQAASDSVSAEAILDWLRGEVKRHGGDKDYKRAIERDIEMLSGIIEFHRRNYGKGGE